MPGPNQLDAAARRRAASRAADLLARARRARAPRTGLRQNVDVGVQYLEAWLRGAGCVPLYNLMEDAATAEISRTQVWQWIRHGARLDDGRAVDARARTPPCATRSWRAIRADVGEDALRRAGRFETRRATLRAPRHVRRARRVPDPARLRRSSIAIGTNGEHHDRLADAAADARTSLRRSDPALERHRARPTPPADVAAPARLGRDRAHARRAAAPSGSGSCCTPRTYVARARRAHRQPGRAAGAARASRRSTSPAGRSRPTRTSPGRCTPTRASIPSNSRAARREAHQPGAAARRPDRHAEGKNGVDWFAPIVADAEAGFGGPLNAFELMKAMIEAGRRRRALRGPARHREEVRPHGRQGARPDAASSSAR